MLRIHASFHKCLTMYYMRVMNSLFNKIKLGKRGYKHYESIEGVFYNDVGRYTINSVNGFAVNIGYLRDDFRISRFIRDPRDLIISGYYYHKRGAEPWFRFTYPTLKYWEPINGFIPIGMPKDISYAAYLEKLPKEEGLIAEIQFRKFHLESLRNWVQDERIKVYKYEDILGNEAAVFSDIFRFYQLPKFDRILGVALAKRYALNNVKRDVKHIRNPIPGQWKEHFTPKVKAYFDQRYGDLFELLGYPK